ncbi:DUF2085 domain-containing protein [Ignavibacterium sp.]|uniref:DUF2085 domain-containing protein n=1 Tax=Ignavibacterium sp. TaxID=2651167 RepID=UPI00220D4D9B|nr:DUF2085 domain-containing protein [Ignavibacterium sp.]BDQ01681.1 MAG: hypothetical protein KatS3mg037_0256 [Ignavibacterium sp.]
MQKKKVFYLKLILLSGLILWNIGIFSPCFIGKDNLFAYHLIKFFYSPLCHQKIEKSFTCNHLQLMVCARCTGIYFGAMITAILNLLPVSVSISKRLLFYSAIPMLVDVILIHLGVYQYNKVISFITGNIFGASVFIFIFEIIKDYFVELTKEKDF